MSRTVVAGTARLRLALAVLVGTVLALLAPALVATQVNAPSAVVLAGLALLVAAAIGLHRHLATAAPRSRAPRASAHEETASFLAERVTDTLRHPLRPRAPGMV